VFDLLGKLFMKLQKVKYGSKLKLVGFPFIVSKGRLVIGNSVTIKSSFWANLIGLYQRCIICSRTPESIIEIGDFVGMSGVTIYARKQISIGDYTLIGANTKIMDNDFHPINIEARNRDDKSQIKSKPVSIGKNCFIGCNSIILKGTVLGDGCVVGAGSVVSGVFESKSVIAGNPARVIRKLD